MRNNLLIGALVSTFALSSCASQAPKVSVKNNITSEPAPLSRPESQLLSFKDDGAPNENVDFTIAIGGIQYLKPEVAHAFKPQVSNNSVLELNWADTGDLRVLPLKKGTATVTFFNEKGEVEKRYKYLVVTNDLLQKIGTIRHLLRDIDGITIESIDDKVVLDGFLQNPGTVVRDLDRILQVQEVYKDIVFNLVTIGPELYLNSVKQMQAEMKKIKGAEQVEVRFMNGTFLISGKVTALAVREMAEVVVQTYLPPLMGSAAYRENVLLLGAKKYSIRNLIYLVDSPEVNRLPASPNAPQ